MLLLPLLALASQVTITPLGRTYDPVPGYPGFEYNGFSSTPATDGDHVALTTFIVAPGDAMSVLLRYPLAGGPPITIVNDDMIMPGSADPFLSITTPALHAGRAWWRGKNQSGLLQGFYSGDGGPVSVVIDNQTSGLNYFEPPISSDGTHVHFTTGSGPAKKLYVMPAGGGTPTLVAESGDPVPGATDEFMYEVYAGMLANGRLVFHAFCQETTFFRNFWSVLSYDVASGTLTEIAGLGTPMPQGAGTFELVGWPATDGNRILFRGSRGYVGFGGWVGIYQWEAGVLSKVIDLSTPRPDGTPFNSFGTAYGWDGNDVVFAGVKNLAYAVDGLYVTRNGVLEKIVEYGDVIQGTPIDTFGLGSAGIRDGKVTFSSSASFGGPQTLWVAELPHYGLDLARLTPVRRGQTARWEAENALPGELGVLLLSTTGLGSGMCPPRLGGLCLDLAPPARVIAADNADVNGLLVFDVPIPAQAPLISVYVQAAVSRGAGGVDSQKSRALTELVLP